MRESYWGYWIILLGVFVIVIMMLVSNVTTTNTQDYYIIKEGILLIDENAFIVVTKSYEQKNANKTLRSKLTL